MAIISKDIEQAVQFLKNDEVVAIPTETVYGLAANALSEAAVSKIYEVKNRPRSNPLIIHVKGIEELETYTKNIPEVAFTLVKNVWPGPLTLLLEKKRIVPNATTAGSERVAVRMPDHPLTLALLQELNFPLAAPSANPFGYISPTKVEHVEKQIGNKIPMILDGGDCRRGVESTIVGFENNVIIIYRLGYLTEEAIKAAIGNQYEIARTTQTKPVTSGMLPYHYSPNTPLFLVDDLEKAIVDLNPEETGIVSFNKSFPAFNHCRILSEKGDLREAAQRLYASLIHLDGLNLKQIYCERLPDEELGKTLNERLTKASNKSKL